MFVFVAPDDLRWVSIGLLDANRVLVRLDRLEASGEQFLETLLTYLGDHGVELESVLGVVIMTGPGSTTALRAGITVVNTLAWRYGFPIFETRKEEVESHEETLLHVNWNTPLSQVKPHYGRGPRITQPAQRGCG